MKLCLQLVLDVLTTLAEVRDSDKIVQNCHTVRILLQMLKTDCETRTGGAPAAGEGVAGPFGPSLGAAAGRPANNAAPPIFESPFLRPIFPLSLDLLDDTITAVALLMQRTRHKRTVSQNHGVRLIIECLKIHGDRPAIIVACCRFLKTFMDKPEHREVVFLNNGHLALQSAFAKAEQSVRGSSGGGSVRSKQVLQIRSACVEALWQCLRGGRPINNT